MSKPKHKEMITYIYLSMFYFIFLLYFKHGIILDKRCKEKMWKYVLVVFYFILHNTESFWLSDVKKMWKYVLVVFYFIFYFILNI